MTRTGDAADLDWLQGGMAEFGHSIGLSRWQLDERQRAALRMESGAVLALELVDGNRVRAWIENPVPFADAQRLECALQAAGLHHHAVPLQVGLAGRQSSATLVAAVQWPWREATAARIAESFERMLDWAGEVRNGQAGSSPGACR